MYGFRRFIARHQPILLVRNRVPRWLGIPGNANPREGDILTTRLGVKLRARADWMFAQPWLCGDYEPYATRIFTRLVEPGDTVFDVGANFGWYSAVFGLTFGQKVKVYAFEPVPSTFALLEETVALNGLQGVVHPRNLGLGEQAGQFTVYLFDELSIGHASASDLGRPDARPVTCSVSTLDEFTSKEGVSKVDFLKIDTEGYELDVLKGGRNLLSSAGAPAIYFEVNAHCVKSRKIDPNQIVELLKSYGYETFRSFSVRTGIQAVSGNIPVADGDYLAFKESHAHKLARLKGVGRLLRWG